MRYAWLRKTSPDPTAVKQAATHPLALIRTAYNAAFWVFLLPFFTMIDYGTGFIVFTMIILVRLGANLYTNNILKPTSEQYDNLPFRLP